ncbi:hypothetical protein ACFX2B_030901 [Malus domestica]
MACFSFTLALAYETRRKKAIGRHLDRLNKETDHHLYLVPTCRAEETSREECCLHTQSTQQKESELKPRTREASTTSPNSKASPYNSNPIQDQAPTALEEISNKVQDQAPTAFEEFQTKFKIKPQRPLKKSPAQFKIKPQQPLKKSPAQFKIKP